MSDNPFVPTPPVDRTYRPRFWPGVVLLAVVLGMLFVPPFIPGLERTSTLFMLIMFAPLTALFGGLVWWLGFSRVPLLDRLLVPLLVALPLTGFIAESVMTGQNPMAVLIYGVPFVLLAFVGWLVLSLPLAGGVRRLGVYVSVIAAWAAFGLIRVEQTDADLVPQLALRWMPKPEDAKRPEREKLAPPAAEVVVAAGDWAEFRGPKRDNAITGVTLDTAAFATPKELWKKEMYPGWGSFAVAGDRLYTMEQQGDNEVVLCLDANTGKQVGEAYSYPAKFTETIAGAGPRSTPAVVGGRVYAMGATGKLTCLNAADLTPVWTADLVKDAGGVLPMWGFASSPLVTDGLVIVYTGGPNGKGTTAFSAADGKVKWQGGKGTHGYSSAQLVTFAGVRQVLMASNYGVEAFEPETGKVLWEHEWQMSTGNRTCQIPILGDGELLLGSGVGILGTRRLKVTPAAGGWDVKVVWTSKDLSPYFNDGVVYQGHYYGFSGKRFHCVDLATGEDTWPDNGTNKYGNGQVLLFAEQGLLLVTEAKSSPTDTGRVFLLKATPDGRTELASFPSLKGKTWNHPSYARGRLYMRNGQEAACYELPVEKK